MLSTVVKYHFSHRGDGNVLFRLPRKVLPSLSTVTSASCRRWPAPAACGHSQGVALPNKLSRAASPPVPPRASSRTVAVKVRRLFCALPGERLGSTQFGKPFVWTPVTPSQLDHIANTRTDPQNNSTRSQIQTSCIAQLEGRQATNFSQVHTWKQFTSLTNISVLCS